MSRLKPAKIIRCERQQTTRLLNRLAVSRQMRTWVLGGVLLFGVVPYALLLVSQVWMPYGLRGRYYANENWSDTPLLIVGDRVPSLRRASRLKPALSEHYSVEWTGVLVVPSSGTYQFALTSDDGSWLTLNGQVVVDNGGYHGEQTQSNTITLTKGVLPIAIRYVQGSGDAMLRVFWQPPGQAQSPLPARRLFVEPPGRWLLWLDQTVAFAWFVFKIGWLVMLLLTGAVAASCPRAALAVLKASLIGKAWLRFSTWLLSRDPNETAFVWLPVNAWPLSRWGSLLLVMSFVLNLWGISWGIPGGRGWVTDELTPDLIQNALEHGFSNTWANKYPPFHYYVLVILQSPFLLLDRLGAIDIQAPQIYLMLFYMQRFVSVLMGTGVVWLTYLGGCVIYEQGAALLAAFIVACMPTFLYYAKNVNLDVPYLFWSVCALYCYLRSRHEHQLTLYLGFTVTATLAVCTKDQAYALFVLPAIAMFVTFYQSQRQRQAGFSVFQAFLHRRVLFPLLIAMTLFVVIHNVLVNPVGFRSHLEYITGVGSKAYALYAPTLAGHAQMLWQALKHLQFSFGWPMFLACLAGLIRACWQPSRRAWVLWLFWPALSYYLLFISVIRYHYVRFFLPICVLLAVFGGQLLWETVRVPGRWRTIRRTSVGLILGYTLCYGATVNLWMTFDGRYDVERWLQNNVDRSASIGFIGFKEYLPRRHLFEHTISIAGSYIQTVNAKNPEYLVINVDLSRRSPEIYTKLEQGSLGYTRVLRHQTRFPWLPLQPNQIVEHGQRKIFTSLEKINPEIQVYQKNP